MVELVGGGSAINGATPSCFDVDPQVPLLPGASKKFKKTTGEIVAVGIKKLWTQI